MRRPISSWRTFVIVTALVALMALARVAHAPLTDAASPKALPGEVVVKLASTADLPGVAAAFALDPVPLDQFGSRPIYRLRILDGASPEQRAAALLGDARVVYAEENVTGEAPEARVESSWSVGGSAGGFAAQWAPAAMSLDAAHAVNRGAGITVAVLDTGVDFNHPALGGKVLRGYDFVDMDGDPSEVGTAGVDRAFGHGTHVAGLVALAAPEAKILPIRVLDRNGVGNAWVLAEALRYAIDPDGDPATHDGADVINLSLSTTLDSRLVREVLAAVTCVDPEPTSPDDIPCLAAGGQGAVVVAAAGNGGSTQPEYPAGDGVRGTLSVGASTQAGSLATFSNRGSWVGVIAPGDRIISTVPGGGFATWSGTSMAAPLAAGEVALVRSTFPTLDPSKVVQLVEATAQRGASNTPPLVNAAAALTPKKTGSP